jgi:hypothetical protein
MAEGDLAWGCPVEYSRVLVQAQSKNSTRDRRACGSGRVSSSRIGDEHISLRRRNICPSSADTPIKVEEQGITYTV